MVEEVRKTSQEGLACHREGDPAKGSQKVCLRTAALEGAQMLGPGRTEQDVKGEDSVQASPGASGFATGIPFWKHQVAHGLGDILRQAWVWSSGDRRACTETVGLSLPGAQKLWREVWEESSGQTRGGQREDSPQRN